MKYRNKNNEICQLCYNLSANVCKIQTCSSCGEYYCTDCDTYKTFIRYCIIPCFYCKKIECDGKSIEKRCIKCANYAINLGKNRSVYYKQIKN